MSELVPIPDVQQAIGGVSRQTVYNMIAAGSLRRVNVGRRAFITRASLEAFLQHVLDNPRKCPTCGAPRGRWDFAGDVQVLSPTEMIAMARKVEEFRRSSSGEASA